jgi:gamma-glutamyltranspeptidase/glutathione hydrolase
MTISHGGALGSCVTVPGTGIVLGHGMFRFDPRPGQRNSVGPRKRPLNNAACMMVRMPGRDVAIGVPGGRRIICVMPRAVQMLVDRSATGREAAAAPRAHVEMSEPALIQQTAGQSVIAALRAMGHDVRPAKAIAGCMNCAEGLKQDGAVRAGGNQSAVGV